MKKLVPNTWYSTSPKVRIIRLNLKKPLEEQLNPPQKHNLRPRTETEKGGTSQNGRWQNLQWKQEARREAFQRRTHQANQSHQESKSRQKESSRRKCQTSSVPPKEEKELRKLTWRKFGILHTAEWGNTFVARSNGKRASTSSLIGYMDA